MVKIRTQDVILNSNAEFEVYIQDCMQLIYHIRYTMHCCTLLRVFVQHLLQVTGEQSGW